MAAPRRSRVYPYIAPARDLTRQRYLLLTVPLGLIAAVGVGMILYLLLHPSLLRAPFTLRGAWRDSTAPVVCPGDTVRYDLDFQVFRVPSLIAFAEGWYDWERNQTAPHARQFAWVPYSAPIHQQRTLSLTVPPLSPGPHRYSAVAQEFGSEADGFGLDLTVAEDCHAPNEQ